MNYISYKTAQKTAIKNGFNLKSILDKITLNELDGLVDRSRFNWQIVGEKIDNQNNPIYLLQSRGKLAHAFFASGGGFVTYQSCINYQSWC